MAPPRNRSILICCMGTRGDVQPFVALALHLQQQRGWRAVLAAPPEFRGFITSYGLQHEDIGISLAHAFAASPQGKALRTASALNAFQATTAFFRLPLLESWFAGVRRLLLALRPVVLLLTSFVAMSGAAALPEILGLPTRVAMAHTIPMHATGAFGMPLAGTGFSAPTAWLNRTQWGSLDVAVARTLHLPRAQAIVDEAIETSLGYQAAQVAQLSPVVDAEARQAAAADLEAAAALLRSRTRLRRGLAASPVPTLYIWSPALLPKPEDWPQHVHVVGPLLLRRQLLAQAPPPLRPVPEAAAVVEVRAVEEEESSIATEEAAAAQAAPPARQPVRSCSSGGSAGSDALGGTACHIIPGTPASPDAAAPPSPGSESDAGSSSGAASEAAVAAGAGAAVAGEAAATTVSPAAAVPATTQPAAANPPVGLPADLQHYLDAALRRQLPVVYIGLGSMLATVFEPQQVSKLISAMVQAVERAAAKRPLCAIIHTTLPPANQSPGRSSSPGSSTAAAAAEPAQLAPTAAQLPGLGGLPPYFLLRQAVPHELLLPQVDLAVHHGGAGTTQAVLLAGKPALVVPCVPSSDQPFWADLVSRRGLGPPGWFPVKRLTPARLASGILAGLRGLEGYTRAAEALAFEMAQEDGVATAGAVLESCLLG